jgi:succinate dehydrogenase / fumarate reductase membrane anchor subunit
MTRETVLKSGESLLWLFQRISGLSLVLLLLLHFIIIHFTGSGEITYERVSARLNDPFWKVFDLAFVFFALTHGFYGLWIVICDYIKWDWARVVLFFGLIFTGAVLFAFAAITLVPFF